MEAAAREVKATPEKGIENASQDSQAATLHGNVRPLEKQSAGQVPANEGSQGVLQETQGRIPEQGTQEANVQTPEANVDPNPIQSVESPAPKLASADVAMATPIIKSEPSVGPGAASASDFPKAAEIRQLSETLRSVKSVKQPLGERISGQIETVKDQLSSAAESSLANLKQFGVYALEKLKGASEWTDFKDTLGKYSGALNRNDFELQRFTKEMRKAVPDPVRREAIINWMQADGDKTLLQQRAAASGGKLRAGYERALELTPDELTMADNVRSYWDSMLQAGIDAGVLKQGIEGYVTQLWDRPNPVTNKLMGEAASGKLTTNFKFARQRVFNSYFEGEQAGFKPKVKDIGALISIYDQSFSRAIAGRRLIKALHGGKAKDGRPLVEVSGMSNLLSESGSPEALLIRPKARPEDIGDYHPIDHPALRGWKWAGTDPETGAVILYQGDMLVHPEVYVHLKNVLSTSAFRQSSFFRGAFATLRTLKQSKLAMSAFHFTQEGAHAAAHRVNPFAPGKIDFTVPDQSSLVDHGLQVADYRAYQAFSEGLSGAGSIYEKVPMAGKWLTRYNELLFQEYIPRLKMSMAMDALERNRESFKNKLSDNQILELTANQSNAAFGELNYTMLGRNPTLQDMFRLAALAPDFLEARTRFVAQAFTRYGTEQRTALALQAATLYVATRLLNQAIDGDPHWEPKYAFSVLANKREYGIRTVVEDAVRFANDPSSYISARLSPLSRAAVEYVTKSDWRGVHRTSLQQIGDLASWLKPITFQKQGAHTATDQVVIAAGVTVKSATAVKRIYELADKFKTDNGLLSAEEKQGSMAPSGYSGLRNAILANDPKAMKQEYEMLLHSTDGTKPKTPQQIREHFISTVRAPFTGSRRTEGAFLKSLDKQDTELYLEAQRERKDIAQKFLDAQQGWIKK